MGPQDPKDVTRDIARHWLTDPAHADLHLRLGNAHAAVEAALVEARRRVRMDDEGQQPGG